MTHFVTIRFVRDIIDIAINLYNVLILLEIYYLFKFI